MSTGDEKVTLYEKQNLGRNDLKTYWFDYLNSKSDEVSASTFLSSGILDSLPITLASVSNDTFRAVLTNASRGADDSGNLMDLANLTVAWYREIEFENANAIPYYVGFRFQSIPSAVEPNPRTALPAYSLEQDLIGELGTPTSVTDNATYIRIVVDAVVEAGVDHSGRLVRVYLVNPVSVDSGIAFYDGVIVWGGGVNYVDITYTALAGPLGQTTPDFPISTTAAHYQVHVKGLSWFRNTDIRTDGNYAFIGIITGNGPAATPVTFDITDQVIALYNSLDNAYRGGSTATPAPGRNISVDKWAVELSQSAATQYASDIANNILRFNRIGETIDGGINTLKLFPNDQWIFDDLKLVNLSDASIPGTDLLPQEDVTLALAGQLMTLTRGAADLTTFEDWLDKDISFIWITGTTNATHDGLYIGSTPASPTTMNIYNLDATVPSFAATGASVKARIFFPFWYDNLDDWASSGGISDVPSRYEGFQSSRINKDVVSLGPVSLDNTYKRYRKSSGGEFNSFYEVTNGKIRMRLGGDLISQYAYGGDVVGRPQHQIDKRSVGDAATSFLPTETDGEHGYDYRGTDFAKSLVNNVPGYQLSQSLRVPVYNKVTGNLQIEEAFTRFSNDQLDLDRVGVNAILAIPGSTGVTTPSIGAGYGWVFAEVEYAAANADDGLYMVYICTGAARVQFKNLDGTTPTFSAGSGVVRFYGGIFSGPYSSPYDAASCLGYLQTLTCPNDQTGGSRIFHENDSLTDNFWQSYIANQNGITWGVRGRGVMYSNAITTRHPTTDDPAADNQISTEDLYVGQITLDTPAAESVSINIFRGQADLDITLVTTPTWLPNITGTGDAEYVISNFGALGGTQSGFYYIELDLPDESTLNTLTVEWDANKGGASDVAIQVFRKHWDNTTGSQPLLAAGFLIAGGTGKQTDVYTPDTLNVIDNDTYQYTVVIRSTNKASTPTAGDKLYGILANFTPSVNMLAGTLSRA